MILGDLVQTPDGARGVVIWVGTSCISVRLLTGEEFGPCLARDWRVVGVAGHVARLYAECRALLSQARRWRGTGSETLALRRVRELRAATRWRRRAGR